MAERYELADKLKQEFRGRGAAVSHMQATSTSELLKRARDGRDPNENVAEEAFRENYTAARAPYRPNPAPRRGAASRPNMGGAEADRIDEEIANRNHIPYRGRRSGDAPSRPGMARMTAETGAKKKQKPPKVRGNKRRVPDARPVEEEVVEHGGFPVVYFALCLIALLFVFSILHSFAQVYQKSSRVSRMEAELEQLKEAEEDMKLKLDEKNDIRNIRDLANKLGMAEEESGQRRFVTISEGERIELLEADENPSMPNGVLFSVLSTISERFR